MATTEAESETFVEQYAASWNTHDASTMSALFTDEPT